MSVTALGKILIVDNDDNISSLLSINLRSEGYDVVIFKSAPMVKDADLSAVRLILADVMDEEYSGISL